MAEIKCPFCGSRDFFLKDPDDAYETYEFQTSGAEVTFHGQDDSSKPHDITDDSETYCSSCAWHGKFKELKK